MKSLLNLLALSILLSLNACCTGDNDEYSDACLTDLIEKIERESLHKSIDLYDFEGKEVFMMNKSDDFADGTDDIYEVITCTLLGRLGGIMGNTNIEGVEWSENAIKIKQVYPD